ncbi:MAG TPA: hypothetical protein VMT57_07045 [Candidatus Thermoplasmatota archaeon]|nr:hypothetical protein [Candidatus Thermoplasmatota archaeon]
MKQPLIVIGIFASFLIGALSGCVGPIATETITKTYAVTDATVVTISNFNGQVDVTGWNGSTVILTAVKKSSVSQADLANINISATSGGHLDIRTLYSGPSTSQPSVDMTLRVPYNVSISKVETSNGPIHLSGTKGDAVLSTSNGAILVNQVTGFVSAATSNAYIEIKRTTGVAGAHTSNAAISVEVPGIRDNISIDTSNAAITVYLNTAMNATVDAATSNAAVLLQGITLSIQHMENTHVIGTIGTDGHRIEVRTSNANIYLHNLVSSIT